MIQLLGHLSMWYFHPDCRAHPSRVGRLLCRLLFELALEIDQEEGTQTYECMKQCVEYYLGYADLFIPLLRQRATEDHDQRSISRFHETFWGAFVVTLVEIELIIEL